MKPCKINKIGRKPVFWVIFAVAAIGLYSCFLLVSAKEKTGEQKAETTGEQAEVVGEGVEMAGKRAKEAFTRVKKKSDDFAAGNMEELTQTLYDYRKAYASEAAMEKMLEDLVFPKGMEFQEVSVKRIEDVNEITVSFDVSEIDDAWLEKNDLLQRNACIIFALLGHTESLNFKLTDEAGYWLMLQFTRGAAEKALGYPLWDCSESKKELLSWLKSFREWLKAYGSEKDFATVWTLEDARAEEAVLEHNRTLRKQSQEEGQEQEEGVYDYYSFKKLKMVEDAPAAEGEGHTVTDYGWAMYTVFRVTANGIKRLNIRHVPVALTFDVNGEACVLKEYWEPEDGQEQAAAVREKFPEDIAEEALNGEHYFLLQMQECYDQAICANELNGKNIVEHMFEIICSGPAASSDPQDYIEEHELEYQEVLYYGKYALQYYEEYMELDWLKAERLTNYIKNYIMALACKDIAQIMGEDETPYQEVVAAFGERSTAEVIDRQIFDRRNPDVAKVMKAYKSVLQGRSNFIPGFSNESEQNDDWTKEIQPGWEQTKFAILDLDGDGLPEVVTAVTVAVDGSISDGDYAVLHYQDGRVYAYGFSNRQLGQLRIDGSFTWSGSAGYWGISTISFVEDEKEGTPYTYNDYAYLESFYDNGTAASDEEPRSYTTYVVNHQETTEEEFNKAFAAWENKPEVTWYALSDENIEKHFSVWEE